MKRRERERERSKRLFLSVEKRRRDFFLGMESKPRRLFLFVVDRARITLDFPFLSLPFPPSLLPSCYSRATLFTASLLPRLFSTSSRPRCTSPWLYLRVFGRVRVSSSRRESTRPHTYPPSRLSVKKALVENHCVPR